MPNNDITLRRSSAAAAREIKASAHYAYIVNGGTLDGSKFAVGELIKEGQCLVRDDVTGKYEKAGASMTGKSNPVILDESIKFKPLDDGTNPDLTFGQAIVHGAVYTAMLIDGTAAFKMAVAAHIRLVD